MEEVSKKVNGRDQVLDDHERIVSNPVAPCTGNNGFDDDDDDVYTIPRKLERSRRRGSSLSSEIGCQSKLSPSCSSSSVSSPSSDDVAKDREDDHELRPDLFAYFSTCFPDITYDERISICRTYANYCSSLSNFRKNPSAKKKIKY